MPCTSSAARLDLLDVLEVVFGYGRAPVADRNKARPNLREALHSVGFITRQENLCSRFCLRAATVEHRRQRFRMGEGVVDTRLIAMCKIIQTAVEQAIVRAYSHQFEVAPGR